MALRPPFSVNASLPSHTAPTSSPQAQPPPNGYFLYQEYLPATYRTSQDGSLLHVNQGNISEVLRQEMLVPKLNRIHEYLWWCAQLSTALPLHEQVMEKRTITVTEQMDLHLVCQGRRIFIKPLPPYLFCHEFWKTYLCKDTELHKCCLGFLLSYVWLIRHESDLALAIENHLVPKELSWNTWTIFVASLLSYIGTKAGLNNCVNKRYLYGEIKLTRLNVVSRYAPEVPGLKGYVHGYGQVGTFFKRNFEWMGLGFLYLVAILTAMQVGLAADHLKDNASFNWASYVFAVFCILLPVTIVAVLLLRHALGFFWFSFGWMRKVQTSAAVKQGA